MRLLMISVVWLLSPTVFGQTIYGVVTDHKAISLPFTNIFVPALKKGTTSNAEGLYKLTLPAGEWKIEFRNIGYATLEKNIVVNEQDYQLDVALNERTYRISEIKVLASGEDPASYVMRRAIAMATYFKNQVSEYSSSVYLKGTGKFGRIPRLLRKALEKQGLKANDVYSIESLSKIDFKLPDQIKQQVIAQRTSGNDNNTSPMPMITSSLYNTSEYGIVSPFDRQALQVYNFRLLGMFEDQGRMINRIQVTPRRKGNDVFEGIINVADGYWSVHSADLKLSAPMMTVIMKQLYGPVDVNTWMPVSLSFDIVFNGMGFEFDYIYVASISDYEVKLNPNLDHSFIERQRLIFAEEENLLEQINIVPPTSTGSRASARMQELLHRDELSSREARELNRLLEKETKATTLPPPLEIEQRIFMDSVRVQRDSLFWETIRPVPLTDAEISGFARKDSLFKVQSTPAWRDSVDIARRQFKPQHILMGATYSYHPRFSETRNTFTIPGILSSDAFSFNTVDGLRFHFPFSWYKRDTLGHAFSLKPEISYAVARKKVDGQLSASYTWNGRKRAVINISGGSTTVDFNRELGMSVFVNDVYSLWFERNYKKFFRRDFAELSHQFEVVNGLMLNTGITWANRLPLQNHSDYHIINWKDMEYSENIPQHPLPDARQLLQSRSLELDVALNWTPRQRYYIRNGFKYYASATHPTFSFRYRKAIPGLSGSDADFDFVESGIRQFLTLGIGNELRYSINAGVFLNHTSLHFSDYRHFNIDYAELFTGDGSSSFKLLPYYEVATSRYFAEGHASWGSGRILLKRLPFFSNTILTELLSFHFLHNDHLKAYSEFGYGIKNVFAIFSLEALAGFEAGKFRSAGLKLGLNLPTVSGGDTR